MKKIFAILSAAVLLGSATANAQELKTGFFVDNYLYGYRFNPSLSPDEHTNGFFGVGIGDITLSLGTNFGLSDFVFPYQGKLVTGLNKNISADQFPGQLEDVSNLSLNLDYNLFSVGRRKGNKFSTFEINIKDISSLSVPRSLFEFFKSGTSNGIETFKVTDISLATRNYMEVAFGHSQKFGIFEVGARVKGLVGLAYAQAYVDEMSISMLANEIVVKGQGSLDGAIAGVEFATKADGSYDFTKISKGSTSPSGYGAAVDLGITAKIFPGLTVNAAIVDLGAISWKKNMQGELAALYNFTMDENSKVTDDLTNLFKFKKGEASGTQFDMLPTMINVGAKYKIPFVKVLSVGALATFRLGDTATKYSDVRAGLTFTPGRILSLTGTYGLSSYGQSIGCAANLRLLGINVFAGVDGLVLDVTPQYIPINKVNTVAKVGVALAFGNKSNRGGAILEEAD